MPNLDDENDLVTGMSTPSQPNNPSTISPIVSDPVLSVSEKQLDTTMKQVGISGFRKGYYAIESKNFHDPFQHFHFNVGGKSVFIVENDQIKATPQSQRGHFTDDFFIKMVLALFIARCNAKGATDLSKVTLTIYKGPENQCKLLKEAAEKLKIKVVDNHATKKDASTNKGGFPSSKPKSSSDEGLSDIMKSMGKQ